MVEPTSFEPDPSAPESVWVMDMINHYRDRFTEYDAEYTRVQELLDQRLQEQDDQADQAAHRLTLIATTDDGIESRWRR